MRIAIPVGDENLVHEEFSRAGVFAIYDVHDQTRAVGYLGRESFAEPGCGRTPAFLQSRGVEAVLGHGVSENAVNQLAQAGIVAIKDAPVLSPDALIAHLVSGTLQATPPEVAVEADGCHPGGCAHCCRHGHEEPHEQKESCAG